MAFLNMRFRKLGRTMFDRAPPVVQPDPVEYEDKPLTGVPKTMSQKLSERRQSISKRTSVLGETKVGEGEQQSSLAEKLKGKIEETKKKRYTKEYEATKSKIYGELQHSSYFRKLYRNRRTRKKAYSWARAEAVNRAKSAMKGSKYA